MNSVVEKLQLKKDQKAIILNSPLDVMPKLISRNVDFSVEHAREQEYHLVLIFCTTKYEIDTWLDRALSLKTEDGALWVAYPKKSSKIRTDLARDDGWKSVEDSGWLPVRQIAIDNNWSALRFKQRSTIKELKRGTDHPAVDSKTKTVIIPPDLQSELQKTGLLDRFNGHSFTQRKEWVISVYDAKKEETRINRIKKIIDALSVG